MRNKHLYPPDWKAIAERCKELAGYRCQHCQIEQGAERTSRRGNLYRVYLQACHKDHTQRHKPNAELLCLCVRCHWWFDFNQWLREQDIRIQRLKHRKLLEKAKVFTLARV